MFYLYVKIELNPRQPNIIQTVRNIGYRFNPELIEVDNDFLAPANLALGRQAHQSHLSPVSRRV